ncbi:MAG: peptidase and in kexin sedolisin, partial [Bacteroidota bacterium]|nr:peptidase and in kexin sedolisin [Bacteroidota bacterium]
MTLIKYDSNGNQLFVSHYDSVGLYDGAVAMELSLHVPGLPPTVAIMGFSGTGFSAWDFCTIFINPHNGTRYSVSRSSNGSGNFSKPVGIAADGHRGFYIAGTSVVSGIQTAIKLIAYDSTFSEVWVDTWGDSLPSVEASAMIPDFNGHLYICGTITKGNGGKDMVVLSYNSSDGSLAWARTIPASNPNREAKAIDIVSDGDGNTYVTGRTFNGNNFDIATSSFDQSGNMRWMKTYARANGTDDEPTTIANDGNNVFVAGVSYGTDSVYVGMEYIAQNFTTTVAIDTDSIPRYAEKQLIVRFDTAVLLYSAINKEDFNYGSPADFLKSAFIDTIKLKLPTLDFDKCVLIKLAPSYRTWDTIFISNIGDTVRVPPFWSSFLVRYSGSTDSLEHFFADSLQKIRPGITWAHLNFAMVNFCNCTTVCPDDTFYSNQEAINPTLTNSGIYNSGSTNAEGAWAFTQGSSFVKVGIFDSEIEWTHEDFMKDSFESKIMGGQEYAITPVPLSGFSHFDQHGTMVAGLVGALRNNGKGISGVAGGNWCNNPVAAAAGVSLYSFADMTVTSQTSSILASDEIAAMNDALLQNPSGSFPDSLYNLHDIDIFNFSHGVPQTSDSFAEYKEKFYVAFRLGKILVASRGQPNGANVSGDVPTFPANFNDDWMLSVGGSDVKGDKAPLTFYGSRMDVIAPYDASMNYSTNTGNSYVNLPGTSFSAPYVSGLAGLLLSYLNNPANHRDYNNLAPEDVEEIMQRTTYFDTDTYYGLQPYTPEIGWGRIDMGNALNMVNKAKNKLYHFDSYRNTTSSVSNDSITTVNLNLMEDVPNPGLLHVVAGRYKAQVWKITKVINHHISLDSTQHITGFWARSSSSESYPLFDTTGGVNRLEPYEKDTIDEVNGPVDTLHATVWGYCYKLHDTTGTTFIGWIPENPFASISTPSIKMSYTVYVGSDSLLPTGIRKISNGFSVSVHPNPATDQIHLDLKIPEEGMYTIGLFNSMGQAIKTLFSGETSGLSKNYDTGDLQPGLYYIRVSSGEKNETLKLSIIK